MALARKIEPNPLCDGFPIQTIVTIASFAETSAKIIAANAKTGFTKNKPKNAAASTAKARTAPAPVTVQACAFIFRSCWLRKPTALPRSIKPSKCCSPVSTSRNAMVMAAGIAVDKSSIGKAI